MEPKSKPKEYSKAVNSFFRNTFLFSLFPVGVIVNTADIQTILLCAVVYVFIFFLGYSMWRNNSKEIELHLLFIIFLFAISSLATIQINQIHIENLVITELIKWIWAAWITERWKREHAKYYKE